MNKEKKKIRVKWHSIDVRYDVKSTFTNEGTKYEVEKILLKWSLIFDI